MADKKPEVLSPAGSMESLMAAVRSGADAVYLGSNEFNARRNAENFDPDALRSAVEYCRIRGVKVYLTLNTLMRQEEIQKAMSVALSAYKAGVHGVILQDLGLARIIHDTLPDWELHASTQMSLHSPAALKSLKELGFCRVVAAREMSRQQLEEFCREAERLQMEVEVFVHGALCMSVSGQCLLSAVLGQRSGNRGLCAGPCRLPFAAENGTGYDLSLKDLSLTKHINRLAEIGVASLKIEGRMKRPEYVAAATSAVRSAVDKGSVDSHITAALEGVFSRSGFTDGYFSLKLGRDMFGIRTKDDVSASKETFARIHELYRNERQNVEIEIEGEFLLGLPSKITITCGEKSLSVIGANVEKAENSATSAEDIISALTKLGGTAYFCRNCRITADEGIFIPRSVLNSLRREGIEGLNSLRAQVPSRKVELSNYDTSEGREAAVPKTVVRVRNVWQLPKNISADAVIFPMEQDPPEIADTILIVELPRWIGSEEKIANRLKALKSHGIKHAFCGNLSAVALALAAGMKVVGDIGLNIYNSESLITAQKMGLSAAVLSAETTTREASKITPHIPTGLFAYGHLPLMLLRNCPLKNGRTCAKCDKKGVLTDRKGIRFPVRCRGEYAELFNSVPIYLADKTRDLSNVDFLLLSFMDEDAETIEKIITAYKNGLPPSGGFTRGLAFRPSL